MYHRIRFASVLSLIVLLSLLFGSGAQASSLPAEQNGEAALQNDLVVQKSFSRAERQAARSFWTRERIAAAPAMALPVDQGAAVVDTAGMAAESLAGAPGFSAAGLAAPGADAAARKAYASDWQALAEETALAGIQADEPAGTTQVQTSYLVSSLMHSWYPHRWIGRVSFNTPTGPATCSGTAISGNVMVTAAHCLYTTTSNTWHTSVVFSPSYRNGSAPYGVFPATSCTVLTAWVNLSGSFSINGWSKYDVGVCKMGVNSIGQTLNTAVGWAGRQWNQPYIRHFHNIGYPARDYRDVLLSSAALYQRACVAESFTQTTDTRGMGCLWGRGISGGPWLVNYAPTFVSGNVDGVNSGLFIGTANMYGPRFTSNNIVPLCTAAAC
ncbi:MAG TPA: hypothetical protein VJ785_12010, partial [Anaerolineales bacterium]|nr:hypothetical protein [Anaerolineales bacterium]